MPSEEGFIDQKTVMDIIESVRDESAQDIAEYVFQKLEEFRI